MLFPGWIHMNPLAASQFFRFAKVHANPARTTGVADTVLTGEKIPVFFCEKKSVAGEFFELNSVVFVKKKGGVTGEFLFLFNTVTAECWIILISLPVKQPQKPWFWPRDESVDEQLGDGIAMSRCSSFEHQLGWNVNFTLWLWLTSPWYRWPIEIDGLPIKNCDFPWIC